MKNNKVVFVSRIVIVLGFILLSATVLYSMRVLAASHTKPYSTQVPSRVPTLAFEPFSATAVNNIFGDISCTWPCWQGITPGLTTSMEATQKLNVTTGVIKLIVSPGLIELPPQMDNNDRDFGSTNWGWALDKGQSISVRVSWEDWVVDSISLNSYSNLHEMPLEKVINRFGPPEKFAFEVCPGHSISTIPLCATLYYPKRGFEIDLFWQETNLENAQITPSSPINNVLLFKPSTIKERLAAQRDVPGYFREADLQDWKGYGNYIDLYGQKP